MKKNNILYFILFLILIGAIFKNWFISSYIIGGDWPFFFQEYINHFSLLPPIWNPVLGNGFGNQSIVYATDSYLYFTAWFFSVVLHIPWPIVYKIVWFSFFLILSISSSIFLFKTIFPKSFLWQQFIAAFLYTTNTYILLVVGGGQMGFALGYAIAPLSLKAFIDIIGTKDKKKISIFHSVLAGFIFAVQILFDFRIAYITLAAATLYFALNIRLFLRTKKLVFSIINFFFIPLIISLLLHAFWILPMFFIKSDLTTTLGSAYTSLSSVTYFSFANFENALGLLHPYWPENIFGKVGFMKPEFLLLPILAFASLLFVSNAAERNKKEKKYILYFALLGIVGIFLAKGANDPFGPIYLWLFNHIPGFVMFRDPTKWYQLITISYSILIPFTVYSVYSLLNSKIKIRNLLPSLFVLLFIIFWLFTIRQAVLGQLSGTFVYRKTFPNEYIKLKTMLIGDSQYSRTLWLPKFQRYGYYDQIHPVVEGATVLEATTFADMLKVLKEKNAEKKLSDLSIKYVIVPFDSEKEIFLKDRKYYPDEQNKLILQLQSIPWLKRDTSFKDIAVYTLQNHKDKFWMQGSRGVSWNQVSDTEYSLTISSGSAEKIIFNESYSSYWRATTNGKELMHEKSGKFNSYAIPSSKKSANVTLSYTMFSYFLVGRIISLITLIVVVYFLLKPVKGFIP